jgi:hypothetical protein
VYKPSFAEHIHKKWLTGRNVQQQQQQKDACGSPTPRNIVKKLAITTALIAALQCTVDHWLPVSR